MMTEYRSEFWAHASDEQRHFRAAVVSGLAGVNGFFGGIGSGKTAVGAQLAFELGAHYAPGTTAGIITPEYRTFWQSTFPEICRWWPGRGTLWDVKRPDNQPQLEIYASASKTSIIHIRSAQDVATAEGIRGPTWAWAWGDEIGTWGAKAYAYDLMLGRLRGRLDGLPLPFPVAYLTGSPRWWVAEMLGIDGNLPPTAWTTGFYVSGKTRQTAIYIQAAKTESNVNNPSGYAEGLRVRYGESFARQELDGNFVPPTSAVFPSFYPAIHVIPAAMANDLFNRCSVRVGGVDWGTASPAALIAAGITGDQCIVVTREWSEPGKSAFDMAEIARQWTRELRIGTWYVDHDAQAYMVWVGRQGDPGVDGTRKARKREVELGLDMLRNAMRLSSKVQHPCDRASQERGGKTPGSWLYISDACPGLAKDLRDLQYRPVRPGETPREDRFVGNDHRPDALRYIVDSELGATLMKGY